MDIHNIIMISITVLSVLLLFRLLNRHKKQNKQSLKLPPGSMGWPYIGETYQLYSQDPNLFFASKQKRYGEIFKTHILGCPCIMLASPEASRFILVSQAHLFKPTYPASKEKLIGPSAIFFHQGDYHALLRKHVQAALSLGTVRRRVTDIETIAVSTLNSWSHGKPINTFLEMKKFSFNVGIHSILGYLDEKCKEELKKNYSIVDKGYNSFPSSMPGAAYQKAIVARKRLDEIIRDIICKRKAKRSEENDLLGHLLNYKDAKGETLSDVQIADNFVGVLFAAQDTMASALTWILKYLHDDQKLLEAVKAEQQAISSEENEGGKRPLTWAQTRNMPLTYRVIMESLRMASIISFTFREAVADVEYKGYMIPKGWKVMPLFRNIHYNPEFFKDPQVFDPSRFEVPPKPNTFMPFGNGVHACPGNELAKMEMLVFVHHLLTKFRWEVVESKAGIQYRPFPIPFNGLPARFWKGSA